MFLYRFEIYKILNYMKYSIFYLPEVSFISFGWKIFYYLQVLIQGHKNYSYSHRQHDLSDANVYNMCSAQIVPCEKLKLRGSFRMFSCLSPSFVQKIF